MCVARSPLSGTIAVVVMQTAADGAMETAGGPMTAIATGGAAMTAADRSPVAAVRTGTMTGSAIASRPLTIIVPIGVGRTQTPAMPKRR